ncbi:type IV toxin-antitoxin system AbiEi family antitoxin domain-containing protein [Herbiconiux moechotypicola]|uniref:Type IV toxin-antitoxin system AbiEi family antitoxin domain-containing protein n=1 Tax=Herbiconiux moechotypicola TaxID=637393 RepID=A0ABP5Q2D1_9MICO|nr:type IV toxin-antitoxin system AbiEi family antitoxin domain-containing protein [Herbiconiux moechotypicola]MCS5728281.1 type IV toxin-antitoxin system AbiEi family antitoxin domain-containing protein [Herbiconiux moechotypicola]
MKELAESLPSTFTTATSRAYGVHPRDLYGWRDAGMIIELSRGVFRRADAPPASHPDMIAVSHRSPRAIVCCVSAAAVHDLTDEMTPFVQIAVPNRSHTPVIAYPPVMVFRFDEATFDLGLTSFEAGPGEPVRVYDPARTVVDLMRFRGRFGEPIAHAALHRYLAAAGARPALLLEYAEVLGAFGPMRAALDVASAR